MRLASLSLGLSLFVLGAAPVSAQESLPVPAYPDFMEVCLSSVTTPTSDRGAFAMAGVLCHCTYEQVADQAVMTKAEFTGAMRSCGQAAQRDPEGFMSTYVPRVQEAIRKTPR